MAFRNNNNRRNNQGGNFNNNNYGGTISRGGNVNPWTDHGGPNNMGNNMGNMGGGGGGRGGNNNDALALANNLLNNLLRNQSQSNVPPSLLDMAGPRGGYNDGPRGYNDFRVSSFKSVLVSRSTTTD